MMTIKEKDHGGESDQKRTRYKEGYAVHDFKLSSVKNLFILAVTKTVENNHNLGLILERLGMDDVEFGYSTELKMVTIIASRVHLQSIPFPGVMVLLHGLLPPHLPP